MSRVSRNSIVIQGARCSLTVRSNFGSSFNRTICLYYKSRIWHQFGTMLRLRLRAKTAQPAAGPMVAAPPAPHPGVLAIADEGWSEMTALQTSARRRHVHWTHVRTHDAAHKQPATFTKQAFWDHMLQVYKDVYPEPANPSGSIVLFGCVASERHAGSSDEMLRDEHKHAPMYTSRQHYWRPVAERSLQQYNVKLHAACHEGYVTMYRYVACQSVRKPLSELDAELFLSLQHPRGQLLQRLLEAGDKHDHIVKRKACKRTDPTAQSPATPALDVPDGKRFRAGDLYSLVKGTEIRNAAALQTQAQQLANDGKPALAEFCTVRGSISLQELLDAAWAVHDAGVATLQSRPSDFRIGKLRAAARDSQCVCGGIWLPGALRVLAHNNCSAAEFGHDVFRALNLGAKRGVNLAIVGPPGCGKSMLLEPLEVMFKVSGKPQRESKNPLEGVIDSEVLLWQDFKYLKKTLAWEDLLSILVGERLEIRLEGGKNRSHKNTSPMFYTHTKVWSVQLDDPEDAVAQLTAMTERFKIYRFANPLPMRERVADFPSCGRCFAKMVLDEEVAWQAEQAFLKRFS